jgi:hypothetical protein
LKEENDRLRQIALSVQDVERLKQENKLMRLEIQKKHGNGIDAASLSDDEDSDEYGKNNTGDVEINEESESVRRKPPMVVGASETIHFVKQRI